ncbi:hypothetical protein Q9189_006927 [Teloschistes chrysophthalmus]
MPPPEQASDKDASSAHSERSNFWTLEQKDEIYNRRQNDHEEASSTDTDTAKKTSVKSSSRGRKLKGDTSPAARLSGKHKPMREKPSAIEDSSDDDSDESNSEAEEPTPTKTAQSPSEESDHSETPRKTRSAQEHRSSKRSTRNAEVDADEESPKPETPTSTRPRRARASGKNYTMLAKPEDFEESADEPVVVDSSNLPLKSPKKSKIVALRTGVPKKATPDARSPKVVKNLKNKTNEVRTLSPRKTRKAVSMNHEHEAASSVASHEETSSKRMSTRLMQANEGHPAPSDDLVDQLRKFSGSGKRRRHAPSKLHLEQELLSKASSAKTSRKRELSEAEASETLRTPGSAASEDDESKEPRRRIAKPKEHLGFLPNGQPRKRRKRRTREQIEIDEANGIDHAAYRKRNRYSFPYLEGYVGPDPPDEATILARQEEHERQNPTRASTSEPESSSSLDSIDEDEETLETPAPDEEPKVDSTAMEVDEATSPDKDDQPASEVTKPQETTTVAVQSTLGSAPESLDGLGEMLFLPEDLAKGRENAAKFRAALEEEKKSFLSRSGNSEAALLKSAQDLEEQVKKTNALTEDAESVKKDLEKARVDLGRAKDNSCGLKLEKQHWKDKHDSFHALLMEVKAENGRLKAEKETLKAETADFKELSDNHLAENDRLIQEMSKEKEQLTADVARLKHEHTTAEESLSDSQKRGRRLDFQNQSFRKDLEYLKHRHAEEKAELKTLADRDLRSAKDSSKALLADREREIRRLNAEINRLETTYNARRLSNTIDLTDPSVNAMMTGPVRSPFHPASVPFTVGRTPTPLTTIPPVMANPTPISSPSPSISSTTLPAPPRPPPNPSPHPTPPIISPIIPNTTTLNTHTTHTTHTNTNTNTTNPPNPISIPPIPNPTTKHLLSVRNAHIRLAVHLRTTSEAFTPHHTLLNKFSKQLEDDEVTMRGVKAVVRELVGGAGKVEGGLKGLREASEGVNGEVVRGLDGV